MSSLYSKAALHILTVQNIDLNRCCGPYNHSLRNHVSEEQHVEWEGDKRYWICEYHSGYDDGVEAMAYAVNKLVDAAYPRQGG